LKNKTRFNKNFKVNLDQGKLKKFELVVELGRMEKMEIQEEETQIFQVCKIIDEMTPFKEKE